MISKKKIENFERKINYKFKNTSILSQSLTHPSSLKDTKNLKKSFNQFERLEFLKKFHDYKKSNEII